MAYRDKYKRIEILLDKNKNELFERECQKLRLTKSKFLRYCINILINKNANNELQYTYEFSDENRYRKLLNYDRIIQNSGQLQKIGMNLYQAVRALNRLAKLSVFSDEEKSKIIEQSKTINLYWKDIQNKCMDLKLLKEELKNVYEIY